MPVAEKITNALKAAPDQRLALHDNSPPEDIRAAFGVSKKAFKQAIGVLFKAGEIVIEKTGIRLAPPAAVDGAANFTGGPTAKQRITWSGEEVVRHEVGEATLLAHHIPRGVPLPQISTTTLQPKRHQ